MTSHALSVQLLSLLAFGALALAMDRHQEDIFGRALARGRTQALRIAGWLALGATLALAVREQGWSLGLIAWTGHISASAGLVFVGLLVMGRRRARKGRKILRAR